MKKLLVLISVIMFSVYGYTRVLEVSWLEIGKSKLDCKSIHFGYNNARIVLVNGEKKTIPISLINSYSLEGKVFIRLPLYKDGKPNGQMRFMELIKTVGELSLYRLEEPDFGSTLLNDKIYSYFLYNGDNLHMALDEKSIPNICKVFGITYSYR